MKQFIYILNTKVEFYSADVGAGIGTEAGSLDVRYGIQHSG